MKTQKYYAVYGSNAIGVCISYAVAYNKRKYIRGFRCKKFDTFDEAEDFALNKANDLFPYYKHIPDRLRLNYIEYSNQMPDVFD